jgi:hypothetical protein
MFCAGFQALTGSMGKPDFSTIFTARYSHSEPRKPADHPLDASSNLGDTVRGLSGSFRKPRRSLSLQIQILVQSHKTKVMIS